VVFYLDLGGGAVGIARILHQRQDAEAMTWAEEL
jgi:hypothetical protein